MKKTYNIIIYVLIGLIVIISIILLIPNKEEKELIVLNLKTKNLEIDQSKNKKIDLDTNGNPSYRSLNTLVAIVTKDGIVLGMAPGETKIEISVNNEVKEFVDVKVIKQAGTIDVNKSEITIVGDSRMVGLCGYKWYKNDNGSCIAKVSMGYNWLVNTAIPSVNKLSNDKKKNIVLNLGVNDLGNINKYLSKYKELSTKTWKNYNIFLLSVNPTRGNYDHLNTKINSFNSKLKAFANNYNNVTYCDSASFLKSNGFGTSDGLHYNEGTSKIIYSQIYKCIHDYYNK